MVQLSYPYMTTGKTIALTKWTFVSKVINLLFSMQSVFASKEQASFNFMAAVTVCSDFGAQENTVPASIFSASICNKLMGLDTMILVLWMLSFKPAFSLSSFTSSRGSSAPVCFLPLEWYHLLYLRLLLFLPAILIPAWDSSSPAFLMMYSACKLNKQRGNIQPWWTPSPFLN